MTVDRLPTRWVPLLGLLALAPVGWYALDAVGALTFVAAVNVLIVVAALWVAMGPLADDSEDRHGPLTDGGRRVGPS